MKKLILFVLLIFLFITPASAAELTAPVVPDSAKAYMPDTQETFAEGLFEILKTALLHIRPDLREAAQVCMGIVAAVMLISLLQTFPGTPQKTAELAGTVFVAATLLRSANSMVNLAVQTVQEISEYGKLLIPVMTSALAAQGGITTSTALYAGTAVFDTVLTGMISKLLAPMVYLFVALSAAGSALGEDILKKLRDTVKWSMTWLLKTILYIFTGYIGITGVISGTTDATALKAAKLTISGVVPVVGGILSDASEAVLIGAGTVKNSVGIYGLFAILAIWIGPFFKIGVHYLLLRLTGALCGVFGNKQITDLVSDFSSVMGLLLGMTGTVCLMLLISMICFMKGVG